jgi:hypothetical protein
MAVRLKFTRHAQDMIQYRNISVDHIRSAIREPDFTEDSFQDRVLVRKQVDDSREIEVVYYREGFRDANDYVIITAYYTSN